MSINQLFLSDYITLYLWQEEEGEEATAENAVEDTDTDNTNGEDSSEDNSEDSSSSGEDSTENEIDETVPLGPGEVPSRKQAEAKYVFNNL